MGAVLAAMLGQIGLPGGGYNYALGALGHTGRRLNAVPIPTLSQGKNGVSDFIPVARVADMLLHPGEPFEYNGRSMQYPDIKLVYWAGGNPFHHHQDINRLRRAFNVPQTIVVHESAWTPMAKFADIVLPATMTLERDDIGAAGTDPRLVAMRRAVDPVGEARDDFDIFAALSRRLGVEQAFTEGRDSRQWLAHLYEPTRRALAEAGWDAPDFEEFWRRGELALPSAPDDGGFLRAFRNDPVKQQAADAERQDRDLFENHRRLRLRRLPAPPGVAALDRTAGFAPSVDADRQPAGDAAAQPARLRCLQPVQENRRPRTRPSQPASMPRAAASPMATSSACSTIAARAWPPPSLRTTSCPAWCNCPPAPGTIRKRGSAEHPLCVHGNPNVLTRDIGTSRLAQGCCGQVTVVECEKYEGDAAFHPRLRSSRSRVMQQRHDTAAPGNIANEFRHTRMKSNNPNLGLSIQTPSIPAA